MADDGWDAPDRAEQCKGELVRAGMDIVLERGWRQLTVRGVAERAGVSPSLVCYHFSTAVRLRREVAADLVADMLRPALHDLTSRGTWQEGVAAVLDGLRDEADRADDTGVGAYDDLLGYGPPGPEQRHVLAEVVVAAMDDAIVRSTVRRSLDDARSGLLWWLARTGVPAEQREGAAVLLVALLDGLLLHHALDPSLPLEDASAVLLADGRAQPRSAGRTSCSKSSMPLVS